MQPSEPKLTRREKQVLCLMAQGHTAYSAGEMLEVSFRTINFHLRNVYEKLDTDKLISAVFIAAKRGYIPNPLEEDANA